MSGEGCRGGAPAQVGNLQGGGGAYLLPVEAREALEELVRVSHSADGPEVVGRVAHEAEQRAGWHVAHNAVGAPRQHHPLHAHLLCPPPLAAVAVHAPQHGGLPERAEGVLDGAFTKRPLTAALGGGRATLALACCGTGWCGGGGLRSLVRGVPSPRTSWAKERGGETAEVGEREEGGGGGGVDVGGAPASAGWTKESLILRSLRGAEMLAG